MERAMLLPLLSIIDNRATIFYSPILFDFLEV